MQDRELTEKIIGCAMKVHSTLGLGFLESVYQKALAHELRKTGLNLEWEKPIAVIYDGVPVGDFSADILVENKVILELKANQCLGTDSRGATRQLSHGYRAGDWTTAELWHGAFGVQEEDADLSPEQGRTG